MSTYPGKTSITSRTGLTNIIAELPGVITSSTIPAATLVFTTIIDTGTDSDGTRFCGTYIGTTFATVANRNDPYLIDIVFTAMILSNLLYKKI